MSSMRSASSSTTKRVWSSTIERSSIRSVSRPGVATTTSTPRAIARTWALRDMPPSTSSVESRAPPARLRKAASICTASSRVGARTSARQVFGAGPAAELEELVQDRQREGRGLAGAGLGDAEDVAARELRGDRLRLDRRRRVEAGAGERVRAAARRGRSPRRWLSSQVFLSARPLPRRLPPSSGACDENRLKFAMPGRAPIAPSHCATARPAESHRGCCMRRRQAAVRRIDHAARLGASARPARRSLEGDGSLAGARE